MKVSHIKKLCGETKVQLLTGDGTVLGVFEPDDIPSFLLERYVDSITPDFTGEGDGQLITEPLYVGGKQMQRRVDDLLCTGHDEIHIKRIFRGI